MCRRRTGNRCKSVFASETLNHPRSVEQRQLFCGKRRQGSNVFCADPLPQRLSCGKVPSREQCCLVFCGSVAAGNYFVQSTVRGALSPYLLRISYRRQLILHKAPSGRCYLVFYESVAAGNYFAQSTVRGRYRFVFYESVAHRHTVGGALPPCLLRISCRRQLFAKDSFCEKMCRFLLPGGLATANCLFSLIRSPHAERTDLFPATRP